MHRLAVLERTNYEVSESVSTRAHEVCSQFNRVLTELDSASCTLSPNVTTRRDVFEDAYER